MSVKSRSLASQVCYIFNGTDFIVNENIDGPDYLKILECCKRHDPDFLAGEESLAKQPGFTGPGSGGKEE